MANRHIDTLLPIIVIVGISFVVALGLFKLLDSEASAQGPWFQLGGGIAGFVVVLVLLYRWHERLDTRRAEELAIEIARLTAISIAREGDNNIPALNTSYNDELDYLQEHFRRQDKQWLNVLLSELRKQTIRQVRQQYPELREWNPERRTQETVVEEIG
jgi:uncharacterized membrane protein